jgi:hypothetical protein
MESSLIAISKPAWHRAKASDRRSATLQILATVLTA